MQDGRCELEPRATRTLLLVRESERGSIENSRDVVWTRERETEKEESKKERRRKRVGVIRGDR